MNLARHPKRSWIIPALTLITGIAFGFLMLELLVFSGPVSAHAFEGELRSRLSANYGADPVVARIHELRLTIVEDVLGMDPGGSSESPALALLMQNPVPTATAKATIVSSPITGPSKTPDPSRTPTDLPTATPTKTATPVPSDTPIPAPVVADYCSKLSMFDVKVDGGDDIEARVRNNGSKHVFLIATVFEWNGTPPSVYVDWFSFDGDRYYNGNDSSSPTTSSGDHEWLGSGRTEKWETDFDNVPGGKIYGSFTVTLTFDVPAQDAHCTLSGSTSKAPPTPEPTDTQEPTDTPEPAPTATPEPTSTHTPEPPTDTPEPMPTDTPSPTETLTPEPTPTT